MEIIQETNIICKYFYIGQIKDDLMHRLKITVSQ